MFLDNAEGGVAASYLASLALPIDDSYSWKSRKNIAEESPRQIERGVIERGTLISAFDAFYPEAASSIVEMLARDCPARIGVLPTFTVLEAVADNPELVMARRKPEKGTLEVRGYLAAYVVDYIESRRLHYGEGFSGATEARINKIISHRSKRDCIEQLRVYIGETLLDLVVTAALDAGLSEEKERVLIGGYPSMINQETGEFLLDRFKVLFKDQPSFMIGLKKELVDFAKEYRFCGEWGELVYINDDEVVVIPSAKAAASFGETTGVVRALVMDDLP